MSVVHVQLHVLYDVTPRRGGSPGLHSAWTCSHFRSYRRYRHETTGISFLREIEVTLRSSGS